MKGALRRRPRDARDEVDTLDGPLVFVTGNAGKAEEVQRLLGMPLRRWDLDLPEIQALDVEAVVRQKAEAAYQLVGAPVLVEDTGLAIDALGGLPGALVRWFLLAVGPAGICGLIPRGAGRGARARSAVALADAGGVEVVVGETVGEIVADPRGQGGFGWDPIFRPLDSPRTFAEMDAAEKGRFSMRRRALEQLRTHLVAAHGADGVRLGNA